MTISTKNTLKSIFIIGGLFFIFGFVTWLNGTLIPFLKIACELQDTEALLVTFAFYISYFVLALPSSVILKYVGYKKGMVLGLLTMALGSLVFIPAAYERWYSLFLFGLFIQGAGLSILQTASNPYIVILGPINKAAVRISIMGICNKVAGFLSPLILASWVMHGMERFSEDSLNKLNSIDKLNALNDLAQRLVEPYIIMAIGLSILAIFIWYSALPNIIQEEELSKETKKTKKSILDFPHLVFGFIALFFYVGAEVIAGDTIGLFGKKMNLEGYAHFTSYTMVFMVVGYILGILSIPKYISQQKALQISAILGIFCSIGVMTTSATDNSIANILLGFVGMGNLPNAIFFVALYGLANALMWPAIFPLAIEGLGKFTKQGSAILIMGIAGGAILPLIFGIFSELNEFNFLGKLFNGTHFAYIIMFPCYIIIWWYATWGYKIRTWRKKI